MKYLWILVVLFVFGHHVSAAPKKYSQQRIIGGELTTVNQYPFQAALLFSWNQNSYSQSCGATILNARSILTAAHCYWFSVNPINYRVRVGSTYANSGGVVHNVAQNLIHPNYDAAELDIDVAIARTETVMVFSDVVKPAVIAGTGYILPDDAPVWAVGWGTTAVNGLPSEELRHVQIWTVNQATCRARYNELGLYVSNNMLCSGYLDVGGRDQCQGDSGGPLIHNGVVVGVCSWGEQCALARYPGVNARVSRFTDWIQVTA